MAPREPVKATPKVQRTAVQKNTTKIMSSPATVKKAMTVRKPPEAAAAAGAKNTTIQMRKRTSTVPKVSTPKPKENKSVPLPGSVTKSAKKPSWKRRPKPAHSGVPRPEGMKNISNLLQSAGSL